MTIKKFDLSTLNGFNGFNILSGTHGDGLGYSVSGSTNVNGDGFGDIIFSAPNTNQVFVLFGNKTLFSPTFELSNIDGTNGFVINTNVPNSRFGQSVAGGCDFNLDGYEDILIGAPNANVSSILPLAGQAFLIYGQNSFKPVLNVRNLNGTNGFVINGIYPFANTGTSVACLGDINNDKYPDIAIGAPSVNNQAGVTYVLFGTGQSTPAAFDLSTLDGINGFTIIDPSFNEQSGSAIAGIGDVNNDGIKDIGIGAPQVSDIGLVYVVYGNTIFPSAIRFDDLSGSNGFKITGDYQKFGTSISSAGDINMDGVADFIIGAPATTENYSYGTAYILFGSTHFNSAITINKSTIETYGFSVTNSDNRYEFSFSVANIHNFLGNNKDSIMICNTAKYVGYAYCAMLHQNPVYSGNIDISNTNFKVTYFYYSGSKACNHLGSSIYSIGDFNGDGISDMVIGDGLCDNSYPADRPDTTYAVFGGLFFNMSADEM